MEERHSKTSQEKDPEDPEADCGTHSYGFCLSVKPPLRPAIVREVKSLLLLFNLSSARLGSAFIAFLRRTVFLPQRSEMDL